MTRLDLFLEEAHRGRRVLILASASPLLAKESERIYGLFAGLFSRPGGKEKANEEVEDAQI